MSGMQFPLDERSSIPVVGFIEEPARKTSVVESVDVLVVGGSQSGVAAAVCAARNGAKVRLVERHGFLGGQSVATMVVQWEKRAFINNLGAVATRGIAKEMLERVLAKGGSDQLWFDPPGCEEMRDGEEWLDIEAIQVVLVDMCEEAGVGLLLHTMAVDALVDRSSTIPRVTGAIFENLSGRFAIQAKIVIDASANLDIVWRAAGTNGCYTRPPASRLQSGFYTWYGGVDNEAFVRHALSLDDIKGYPNPKRFPEKVWTHVRGEKLVILSGFQDVLRVADERGLLDPVMQAFEAAGAGVDSINLNMKRVGRDRWCLHLAKLRPNLLDAWDVTRHEVLRTRLASAALDVLKLLPGWEHAYIARSSVHIGQRETRLLVAVTMLTRKDIFEPDHARADAIGRSGAHDPGKNKLATAYPIPYGILVPAALDGVICCTRALGLADGIAITAHRGITPTIVVGQAAGTAAALSVASGVQPRDVDLQALRARLRAADVVLDVEHVDLGITRVDVDPLHT